MVLFSRRLIRSAAVLLALAVASGQYFDRQESNSNNIDNFITNNDDELEDGGAQPPQVVAAAPAAPLRQEPRITQFWRSHVKQNGGGGGGSSSSEDTPRIIRIESSPASRQQPPATAFFPNQGEMEPQQDYQYAGVEEQGLTGKKAQSVDQREWDRVMPKAPLADGAGTKGKTDGEPGNNVQAHCCGMKGLGGATVEVLCHPTQVAPGMPFTVNVRYASDIPRPVDVHVDVLNAETKTFYAGKWQEMEDMQGDVSLTINMAPEAREPFLWKVFVTPRGEPFPNMLAETGFVSHLGATVEGDCAPIPTKGFTPKTYPEVNSIILKKVPAKITPGATIKVALEYDLVTEAETMVGVSLMRKGPNTLIASNGAVVPKGHYTVNVELPVPADVAIEPVYIVATMTPVGKTWEDRLGEDRTYRVDLVPGMRRLRQYD